MQNSLYKKVSK